MLAEELTVSATDVMQVEVTGAFPDWLRQDQGPPGFRRSRGAALPTPEREVILSRLQSRYSGQVEIGSADGRERVRATADAASLDRLMPAGEHLISWVVATSGPNVTFQLHRFLPVPFPDGPVQIGVDDAIRERVGVELKQDRAPFANVEQWLLDEFSMIGLAGNPRRRVIHSGGPSDDAEPERGFTLLGRNLAADIAFRDGKYGIRRLTAAASRRSEPKMRFATADLRFVDASTQTATSEAIRAALSGLLEDRKSYMELWRAYNEIEREAFVEEAASLGVGHYRTRQLGRKDQVWTFELDPGSKSTRFLKALKADKTELEAAAHPPPELAAGTGGGRTYRGKVVSVRMEPPAVDLRLETRLGAFFEDPPMQGALFLALSGSRISQERRERARERIFSVNAEMPGLAALIEGVGTPPAQGNSITPYRKILRQTIRESFANGDPTESQRLALTMALATPDLLLVQGPPGTGKTQFITALLRCLDAVGESSRAFNRTLITSYQHDAVDHVVSKSRNRGLPPTRIDADAERSLLSVEALRREIKDRAGERHDAMPEVAGHKRLNELKIQVASYDAEAASPADLVDLLHRVEALAGEALPHPLRERLIEQQTAAADRAAPAPVLLSTQHLKALHAARALRCGKENFADDGPSRAADALAALDAPQLLEETDGELLARAAAWDSDELPDFLDALGVVQLRLLERLGTDSTVMAPIRSRDSAVQALLHEIAAAVEDHLADSRDGVGQALADYLQELEGDVASIRRTLHKYNAVLASTVQQADSTAMHKVLEAPLPVFGSVVVDEAARANPLDLMIPLSCARKRIVLVGDHKQLPHVMERKLERELQRTGQFDDTSLLQQSLFQRWFDMFDGKHGRIRTITLNEQFRMHPVLGRFVSETFYGDPEAVSSHPSTEALTHDLDPYAGTVAGWIDVPHSHGPEERVGTSHRRLPEAQRIAEELRALADRDRDRKYSFGVIAFYDSQVTAIWNALVDEELAVPGEEDEKFQPVPHMAWTEGKHRRERLRVGTVDSFQGMEFDVVLLSVTRSSDNVGTSDPRSAIQRYGHLTSDQRMCVAMSRQRRLLLAVGDAAMGKREFAPPHPEHPNRSMVEGLTAFHELCRRAPDGAGIRS